MKLTLDIDEMVDVLDWDRRWPREYASVCGVWGVRCVRGCGAHSPFEDDIELRPDLGDLNPFLSPYGTYLYDMM